MAGLDPHARPPEAIQASYKKYQKMSATDLTQDPDILDFTRPADANAGIHAIRQVSTAGLADALGLPADWPGRDRCVQAYELDSLPGLHIIPGLLDAVVQRELLDRLLHRDLADPRHRTNVGMHYHVPYEACGRPGQLLPPDQAAREANDDTPASKAASFFTCPDSSAIVFRPLDPSVHKELSISQVLKRKLRWMTLGGQYDWTRKVYHTDTPSLPSDIASVVRALFPDMQPESAICNVYTPSDTLSLHRDVAEEADAGLASLSIGCDAIFLVGGAGPEAAGGAVGATAAASLSSTAIRLRSGDAVYMSGPARYAWHGVPKVLRDTCPTELESWPAGCPRKEGDCFAQWRGWLAHKRINLNVRQMRP